nr:hypothetical protein CFP56_01340 [Quercus suber]
MLVGGRSSRGSTHQQQPSTTSPVVEDADAREGSSSGGLWVGRYRVANRLLVPNPVDAGRVRIKSTPSRRSAGKNSGSSREAKSSECRGPVAMAESRSMGVCGRGEVAAEEQRAKGRCNHAEFEKSNRASSE